MSLHPLYAVRAAVVAVTALGAFSAQAAVSWVGTGANTNWATTTNWSNAAGPASTDTVIFTDTGSSSLPAETTSLVNIDRAIGGLSFSDTAGKYHTLDLGAHTLTVSGNVNFNLDQNAQTTTTVRDGALVVSGTFANINVGTGVSGSSKSNVDFSGLTSLNTSVQNFLVGASTSGSTAATLTLAPSNTIIAQMVQVGASNNSGDTSGTLHLGLATTITTAEFDIAKDNSTGLVDIVSGGVFNLGTSAQRTLLQIANQNYNNQYNSYTGQMNLGNAAVTMYLSSLIVAEKNGGPGGSTGVIQGGGSGSAVVGSAGARGNVYVGYSVNGGTATGTADLSHLTSFQATVSDFFVGKVVSGSANGTMMLPPTATIDAANSIAVGGTNGAGSLTLGRTSNTLLTPQLIVGQESTTSSMQIPSGSVLNLGSSAQRTSVSVGIATFNNQYLGNSGRMDLTGATFNGYLNQVIVGQKDGAGYATGALLGGSGGALDIGPSGNTANIYVGNSQTGGGSASGLVDFSGLNSLTANLNTLSIGVALTGSSQGTMSLPAVSTINATSIVVGNGGGGSNTLTLGRTSNTLLTSQFVIGANGSTSVVQVAPGATVSLGSAAQRTSLSVANNNFNNQYATYVSELNLTGTSFTSYLSQLIVGQKDGGPGGSSGTLVGGNGGTMDIGPTGNTANFYVGNSLSSGAAYGNADLSGLSALSANLNTLAIGTSIFGTAQGVLKLPSTSTVNANTIIIGDIVSGPYGVTNTLVLGLHNTILANQVSIGQDFTNGLVQIASGGTLSLGSSSQRTNLSIATTNTNDQYGAYSGMLDLTNASVTAYLGNVIIDNKSPFPNSETGTFIISNHSDNYVNASAITLGSNGMTGIVTFGGGALVVGTFNAGTGTATFNWNGGTLSVGTFGTPTQPFNLVNTGTGNLAPGAVAGTTGTTTVYGTYTQGAAASMAIQIAGVSPGTGNDQVNITGTATLAGTLKLSTVNGFVPAVGQNFLIATYASHTGTFAFVAPPVLPQNVAFQLDYTSNPTQLLVHMVSPVAQSWISSAATGTWGTGTNWSTSNVPGTTTNASVTDTGAIAQTVTVATSTTVQQVTVQGNTQSMTLEVLQGVQLGVSYELIVGTNGTLRGGGHVLGNVVVNGGVVAQTAQAPTTLFVGGNLTTQPQSTVQIDIAGILAQNDVVSVGGTFAMAGNLKILDTNGFVPALGNTFQIFQFGGQTGQFGHVDLPPLAPGLGWDLSSLYTGGTIGVVGVPEPGSLALLAMGAAGLMRRRRKARTE